MPITLAGSGRRRVVERDTSAGAGAGSAHGSIVVAGRRGCAAPPDGVVGTTGRGDVTRGVDSAVRGAADGIDRVGALGSAAAGLSGSKGGGSVGFLTWSGDGVESTGPTVFAGGEVGAPLCA